MESSFNLELHELFQRDLDRLIANLAEMPESRLWEVPEGVNNSCGVLAQHLVGNLNYFIGNGLGGRDIERDRKREFSNTGTSKARLISDIRELKETLSDIFQEREDGSINEDYALDVPFDMSPREFLIHLYGHLNYHLGQFNYLRRLQTASPS